MARRNKGRPVSGWLVIDKPAGMPSAATRQSDQGTVEAWAREHFQGKVHLPSRLDRSFRSRMRTPNRKAR